MLNKYKKITSLPIVLSILIIICVATSILMGFITISVPSSSSGNFKVFNFFFELSNKTKINTFSDDGFSSILAFINVFLVIISSFTNIIFSLTKKNKMVFSLILNLLTLLGITVVILHYALVNSSFSFWLNKASNFEKMIPVFAIIIASIAGVLSLANIICNIIFRKTIFACETKKNYKAILLMLVSIGLVFDSIILVLISGFIPFFKKVKYISGITKEPVTKIVSSCAYDNIPCVLLIILFVTMTLAFFIWATSKNKYDILLTNLMITGVLGIVANITQFFECGGISWLFGIGTFMIIGAVITFGASKVLEKAITFDSKIKKV